MSKIKQGGRYIITERRDRMSPSIDDPKVRYGRAHTGCYDLRDADSDNVICATGCSLPALRKLQARWNSMHVLNTLCVF